MRKRLLALIAAMALVAAAAPAQAHDYDRDDSDHPIRLVAYILHPIGVAVEYVVLRPIHKFVSSTEKTRDWFGADETPQFKEEK